MAQESGPMEFPYALFPESETEFFLTATDAQISFIRDAVGTVVKAVLHDNRSDETAIKVK